VLAAAVALPTWLVVLIAVCGVISAVATAGSNIAAFLINWLKLRQIHDAVKTIGRRVGLTDSELK